MHRNVNAESCKKSNLRMFHKEGRIYLNQDTLLSAHLLEASVLNMPTPDAQSNMWLVES